jgi:hypothetical protein
MGTESGYYFTHIVSAVSFIKTLDSSSLSIDPDEFNQCLEAEDAKLEVK